MTTSHIGKGKNNIICLNKFQPLDFWYRKWKPIYWGQSRHGLDLGDPKNTASPLIAPHIETVGRLLVWSDCLSTRDDILLPSIVLLCRWLNIPNPAGTRPALSLAMRGLSENLQCKNPSFFINWLDPLDLSKRKKLSDLCYICPRGTREGMPLFFWKKVFLWNTLICTIV